MLYEPQTLCIVGPRHQGPVFTARETVLNPTGILMPGSTDATVKRATTAPTEENVFVGELFTRPAPFLL